MHPVAGGDPPGARVPSPWRVLQECWRSAGSHVRLGLGGLLGAWLLVSVLQLWDVRERSGPAVVAELASVLLGSFGTFLFCAASVLDAAGARERAGAPALRRMLIALPVLANVATALLALAVGIAMMRVMLGGWAGLLGAILWGAMLVLCNRAITGSSRVLWEAARSQGEAAARAETDAAQARLAALRAQLDPHFLFNALNTVAALVPSDAAAAELCVERLADVLRRTLRRGAVETVGDEIDYLRAYLGIEEARRGDRLLVTWDVEAGALEMPLPPMLLQPLVENALKHGISGIEGGRLVVGASLVSPGRLRLRVEDDGSGFAPGAREGVGIDNLRQRLATAYGAGAELRFERREPGTRVVLELPAHPEPRLSGAVA